MEKRRSIFDVYGMRREVLMGMNGNEEGSRFGRLDSVSQIMNWALENGERVVVIGENPQRLSVKKKQFESKWDNLFHVNLTLNEDQIQGDRV